MDSSGRHLYMRYAIRCTVIAELVAATLTLFAVVMFFFRQELFAADFTRNVRYALAASVATAVLSVLHIVLRNIVLRNLDSP
jgi:hypothetical protein